jgi:formate-dependent nitrite reductase cytochrome c552 subunit
MSPNPAPHTPQLATAFSGEVCAKCHLHYDEWRTSAHGTVLDGMTREEFFDEWDGSCSVCHISEGFIMAKDSADWAGMTLTAENANQVTCVTCHDPHSDDNSSQLRTLADVSSPYGGPAYNNGAYMITGLGKGMICAQCHHARRSSSSIQSQFNNGSAHPGPHESPQADMVMGYATYEIPGYTYVRDAQHTTSNVADMCVDCHMYTVAVPYDQAGTPVKGHSFAPDVRACAGCHNNTPTFDVEGVQSEITHLLDSLGVMLPQDTTGHVMAATDTIVWTRKQREAGYTYLFVEQDKSKGVHNYNYARTMLENAITYLLAP